MNSYVHLRNSDIKRVLAGIPEGHSHIRVIIETADGETIVLQEATIAAIVRAYTSIKTSPMLKAVELRSVELRERKQGYADHQLMETGRDESQVATEINRVITLQTEAEER
jgi:hypothetical protein